MTIAETSWNVKPLETLILQNMRVFKKAPLENQLTDDVTHRKNPLDKERNCSCELHPEDHRILAVLDGKDIVLAVGRKKKKKKKNLDRLRYCVRYTDGGERCQRLSSKEKLDSSTCVKFLQRPRNKRDSRTNCSEMMTQGRSNQWLGVNVVWQGGTKGRSTEKQHITKSHG